MMYGFVAEQLDRDIDLQDAVRVQSYEALCAAPEAELRALFTHCGLSVDEELIAAFVPRIQKPDYYDAGFSDAQIAMITEITQPVAMRFGY
jgi:hypothetical protein